MYGLFDVYDPSGSRGTAQQVLRTLIDKIPSQMTEADEISLCLNALVPATQVVNNRLTIKGVGHKCCRTAGLAAQLLPVHSCRSEFHPGLGVFKRFSRIPIIPAIRRAANAAIAHQIVEDDATRAVTQPKQTRRLMQMQGETGHLRKGSQDQRDEV